SIEGDLEETGIICFYYNISIDNNACLRDHLVFNESVLPTDAYIELIYSAFKEHFGIDQLQLRNIKINQPFVGKTGNCRLTKLELRELSDGQLRFIISSSIEGEDVEMVHVKGFIELENIVNNTPLLSIEFDEEIEKNCNQEQLKLLVYPIEVKGIYDDLLKSAKFSKKSASGTIDLKINAQKTYIAQLLDAGLFCSMSYGHYRLHEQESSTYLPYEIEKITINDHSTTQAYRCVVFQNSISSEKIVLSFELIGEDEKVLLRIEGLQLRLVTKKQILKSITVDKEIITDFSPENISDVAVIGISCRFPEADNADEFWENLSEGVDSIKEIDKNHWRNYNWYNIDPHHEGTSYSRWAGFINDSDKFDPLFFGISPGEALIMDPQQRLFLEESWKAIEDAGYSPQQLDRRKVSVFVGAGSGDYLQLLKENGEDTKGTAFTGCSQAILAARISYFMNFTGPALAIDTACSSSLVAMDRAYQSILSGESEMSLVGGISLLTTPISHIWTSQVGMPSKSGRCKTFDDNADGIVSSEGVGVVVLKKLKDAERDGDRIYAVIKGSGINQDGRTNGITAPSVRSQSALQLSIYQKNQIDPSSISYIEAHGTGTRLGDPIEIEALTDTFDKYTTEKQFCAIGSVKTNIGHTGYVSGVAGLIKTILMMKHRQIVPSLHY
ncbi:beta-ketoacyl synthase N-terminal-like domain-containing protein, partial [Flavobacterium sp. H122]|uniref:beta-ketoacyl synthase N-terminal-like domain-containing protein n=1 Tax=Flavobacterium sp. H122 TaxID=2529860 RepID=UPI001B7D8EAD